MVISKLGINLGYKTFFNLNFILTYNMNMYVPVLSSLFYCVPCNLGTEVGVSSG